MKIITHITIKPAPGRRVRDPETEELLNPEGEAKPATSYWLRRLRDGDVVAVAARKRKGSEG